METIQSTQVIFDGRIVHLKVHDVSLPDGSLSKRELIYHQGASAIVILDDENTVLMVRQYRIGAGKMSLEIPAGLLERDEDPEATAIRESREETGYRPQSVEKLGGVYAAPGYTTEYIHLYLARGYTHDPLPQDADEIIELVKLPLIEALAQIETGEIFEAKTIVALLRVARRLGI